MQTTEVDSRCPNCQTTFPEDANYCKQCGQKRLRLHDQSVKHLVVESVGDFFHFDAKFLATLWPLIFRPGFLTTEFLEGKRAKYFEPFKLFLFLSFLFFLTSGILNHRQQVNDFEPSQKEKIADTANMVRNDGTYKLHLDKAYNVIFKIPDDSLRKMVKKYGLNVVIYRYYPLETGYSRFMIKQVVKNRLKGSYSLDENMSKTLPKLVFILIPFFALLLKLIYSKNKILYFDHVIFSLHFLSFYFLLFWLKEIVSSHLGLFNLVFSLLLIVYLFLGLHRVYRQTFWKTIAAFSLLAFGTLIILGVFFMVAASISFMLI